MAEKNTPHENLYSDARYAGYYQMMTEEEGHSALFQRIPVFPSSCTQQDYLDEQMNKRVPVIAYRYGRIGICRVFINEGAFLSITNVTQYHNGKNYWDDPNPGELEEVAVPPGNYHDIFLIGQQLDKAPRFRMRAIPKNGLPVKISISFIPSPLPSRA